MRLNKYRNKKTTIGGLKFDSKLESRHYLLLKERLRKGEIISLARQVRIPLTYNLKRQIVYVADFVFFDVKKNEWVIWDSKGKKIQPYQTKRAWLLDRYCGFVFLEVGEKEIKEYTPCGLQILNPKILIKTR